MPELKDLTAAGWLKDADDNFQQLEPLIAGDAAGLGVLRVARFVFDCATVGNRTIAAHGTGVTIPIHGIVVGGFIDVNTAFTSANDVISAAAVSGAPYSTIGRKAIIPKANTPESTSLKASAAREITCTVAVEALLTGKLTGYLYYVEGVASA